MATSPTDRPRDPATITMSPQLPTKNDPMAARRASARRTALIVAGIALVVYAGFILINTVAQ
jgi:hypothetical protein